MELLGYDTILDHLKTLPANTGGFQYKELLSQQVPDGWQYLGTLLDEKIRPAIEVYKHFTHYALGFYPFNGCDIYEDEEGRVLLSYIEFGGHAPFRTSYIATKASPFIIEPVAFSLQVHEKDNDAFMDFMMKYGITKDSLEEDLLRYKNITHITDELTGEEVTVLRKHRGITSTEWMYTIIATRSDAHAISSWFQ